MPRIRSARRFLPLQMGMAALMVVAAGANCVAQQGQSVTQQQYPGLPWTKLCTKVKVADQANGEAQTAPEVNLCRTVQEGFDKIGGGPLFVTAIQEREGGDGSRMMVTVPLGVDLRSGVQVKIDGGRPFKLDYASCTRVGCTADVKVSSDLITTMKSGQQLFLEVKGPRGKAFDTTIPLEGFAAAYDGNAADAQKYQELRQKLSNAICARRADQLKKALEAIDSQSQQQQSQQVPSQQQQSNQPKQRPQQ